MSLQRVDTTKLIRGAARLLYAPSTQGKPAKVADVLNMTLPTPPATTPGKYDPKTGWVDLGSTQNGIQIEINNTEDAFDIDQIAGEVGVFPNMWEVYVATTLAESTLENFVLAWEGVPIITDTSTTPNERETAFAGATAYTERRLAIIFSKPPAGGTASVGALVAYLFHRAVRTPQQGTLDFRKTGNNLQVSVRFRILADSSEVDPRAQFFRIREQVSAGP